jgi:hypothetical protein
VEKNIELVLSDEEADALSLFVREQAVFVNLSPQSSNALNRALYRLAKALEGSPQ